MKKILPLLNNAINTYLNLDPASPQRLQKLKGSVIDIEFLPFHFQFQCLFTQRGVTLQSTDSNQTDAYIRGTPLQMLGMMLNKDNRQQFFADDISIEGNVELGQQVVELFDELQIDWEDQLAKVLPDIPAYYGGRLLRGVRQWFKKTDQTFSQDINEYIHEETEWFPHREAMQDLFNDIDTLRMDVDRMAAKADQLQIYLTEDEVSQ